MFEWIVSFYVCLLGFFIFMKVDFDFFFAEFWGRDTNQLVGVLATYHMFARSKLLSLLIKIIVIGLWSYFPKTLALSWGQNQKLLKSSLQLCMLYSAFEEVLWIAASLPICPPNPLYMPTVRHQVSIVCNYYAPFLLCCISINAYGPSFWKHKRSFCIRSNTGRKRKVKPCGLSHSFLLYHLT